VVYLEGFDLSSEYAQTTLDTFCQRLQTFEMTYSDSVLGSGSNGSVKCFIQDLKQWLLAEKQRFPVPQA
jgi:hypothetical protein